MNTNLFINSNYRRPNINVLTWYQHCLAYPFDFKCFYHLSALSSRVAKLGDEGRCFSSHKTYFCQNVGCFCGFSLPICGHTIPTLSGIYHSHSQQQYYYSVYGAISLTHKMVCSCCRKTFNRLMRSENKLRSLALKVKFLLISLRAFTLEMVQTHPLNF